MKLTETNGTAQRPKAMGDSRVGSCTQVRGPLPTMINAMDIVDDLAGETRDAGCM